MSIYKARWNKAKALAQALNKRREEAIKAFGKKVIFMWRGEFYEAGLTIEDDTIYIRSENCIHGIFDDDPAFDHGSHTPIKEIEELFNEFEVFVPWQTT